MNTTPVIRATALMIFSSFVFFINPSEASPRATFSGQGSADAPNMSDPDGFPGTLGDGWDGSWERLIQFKSTVEADEAVMDTNPFDSQSGDYLRLNYRRIEGETGSRAGVVRAISNDTSSGGIDSTKPYTVKFQFRLDDVSPPFSEITDQITFAESVEVNSGGPSEVDRWIMIYRGGSTRRKDDGGVWTAFQGGGTNGEPVDFGPQNSAIEPGIVCNVAVMVDPVEGVWDAEISYDGTFFKASEGNGGAPLNLRNTEPPVDPTQLSFRASRNGDGKSLAWSIDNIEIAAGND